MEWKWAIYGGDKRRLYRDADCQVCGSATWSKKSKLGKRKFCSQRCAGLGQRDYETFECANCGKSFERNVGKARNSKSGYSFCSRTCKDIANRIDGIKAIHPPHFGLGNGLYDYRERALKAYGSRCTDTDCPIQNAGIEIPERMIDVHHIDSDRSNNSIENLEVVCVWCHAVRTRKANEWKVFGHKI